mgnify:CR=1 FL=1
MLHQVRIDGVLDGIKKPGLFTRLLIWIRQKHLIMTDNQLKIRIQIAQSPDLPEQHDPALTRQDETDQFPLDWRKILLSLMLMGIVLGFIGYSLFNWINDVPSLTQTVTTKNDPVIPINKAVIPPADLQAETNSTRKTTEYPEDTSSSSNEISAESASLEKQIIADTAIAPEPEPEPEQKQKQNISIVPKPLVKPNETSYSARSSSTDPTKTDQPHVVRALLTRAIQQQEPIDTVSEVWLNRGISEHIYFFVQLRDLNGQRVSVHWYYQDREVAKVNLRIGNQNWRTNASKILSKARLGAWRVAIHDQSGNQLAQRHFTVGNRP